MYDEAEEQQYSAHNRTSTQRSLMIHVKDSNSMPQEAGYPPLTRGAMLGSGGSDTMRYERPLSASCCHSMSYESHSSFRESGLYFRSSIESSLLQSGDKPRGLRIHHRILTPKFACRCSASVPSMLLSYESTPNRLTDPFNSASMPKSSVAVRPSS